MTTAILIGVLASLVALTLVLADRRQESTRRKYKSLATANLRARQVIRDLEAETRAQLAAGNATFEQTKALLDEYREAEAA